MRIACLIWFVACGLSGALAHLNAQQFTNVTTASGINAPAPTSPNGIDRGCAWADFNNDGTVDVVVAGNGGMPITLFKNNGNSTFTSQVILPSTTPLRADHGCVTADIDNDGDEDLYVTVAFGYGNLLFVNAGNATFTEEAATRGVRPMNVSSTGVATNGEWFSASFADYDRDGWIDLLIGERPTTTLNGNRFVYHNNGNGYFTNVTVALGVVNTGMSYATIWHDYNKDGWPDIIYGNERASLGQAPVSGVYRNNRNGSFTSVGVSLNANAPVDTMGITVGDIDNDGDWDIHHSNLTWGSFVGHWNGTAYDYISPNYWAVAASLGILCLNQSFWNCNFFDYNNDGKIDLWVQALQPPNHLFKNLGGTFIDTGNLPLAQQPIPNTTGSTYFFQASGSVTDYNDDGSLDIFFPGWIMPGQLLKNPGYGGNWLKLKLVGTTSNRTAIGAVVRAKSALGTQQRMVTSGEGYLCDSDKRVHFGLGSDSLVTEVEIRWPSGTVSYLSNVAVNQVLTVTEPLFVPQNAPMTPGSTSTFLLDLPSDVGLNYVAGLSGDATGELYLPDNRAIRVNVNDPVLALTTTFGNPILGYFAGPIVPGGTSLTLSIPAIPLLTGYKVWLIAVSIDPTRPGGIKSILGPYPRTIQ